MINTTQACRARNLPVIFDEVMTGLYRLGALSAAQLLRQAPDIACYAKILTAGAVPMAATLTTSAVFDAFSGPSKLQALLHGHSYTAYPIGCAAAVTALDILTSPSSNPNLCTPEPSPRRSGEGVSSDEEAAGQSAGAASSCRCRKASDGAAPCALPCGRLLPLWDEAVVARLSHHPLVARVLAIGTVVAVEIATQGGVAPSGQPAYATGGLAVEVARRLRSGHGIYCRPLGPVIYLMVPPTAERRRCDKLLGALGVVLDGLAASGPSEPEEEGVIV